MVIPSFVDRVKLTVQAGNGGHNCVSVHRGKLKPLGGPGGDNSGDGGSMILRVVDNPNSLAEYHRQSVHRATDGQPDRGDHQHGVKGENVVLAVLAGTIVSGAATGKHPADLIGPGEEYVAAVGGKGGSGNEALAAAARKASSFAFFDEEGESRLIQLELKALVNVGLVGFPSVGKSLLIVAISKAQPRIADYPFTTPAPSLGVVVAGDLAYTTVDIPGLTEGASLGKGLGFDFLQHIERYQVIIHVINLDTWEPGREPVINLDMIEGELVTHGGLEDHECLVALNELDLPDVPDLAELAQPKLEKHGYQVFEVSTKIGEGLNALKFVMTRVVETHRAAEATEEPPKEVLRPRPMGRIAADDPFTIAKKDDGEGSFLWWVCGVKPEHWIHQTDFNDVEMVGYLADRSNRFGVEEKFLEFGAQEGDAVVIRGDDAVMFDFTPQIGTGAETFSWRGENPRLESERPAVARRRRTDAKYHARKASEVVDED